METTVESALQLKGPSSLGLEEARRASWTQPLRVLHAADTNNTPGTSVAVVWEALKAVVRGQFIAIAVCTNALWREKRRLWEAKIKELEGRHRETNSMAMRRQLKVICKQLHALDTDNAEYALLRTKQRYYVGGRRVGRLLAHRLHAQAVQQQLNAIQTRTGTVTSNKGLILKEFEMFFASGYTAEQLEADAII
ncbi:hypothetical protein NDU88_006625 [Pleurodeles waltl]|uniref:Uncharacterized protein n=1 Tax=Pleurodeles waltl TaxID=8319 RepID=A0AAV7WB76_PLEWA|nr:hypothetical protein NDU88_006625 [Pleurodeles waltl]